MSATINSIPASYYVNVTPGVLAAGSEGITLTELMLTTSLRPPIGSLLSFPDLASVKAYFGNTSLEATEAAVYFAGYNLATIQPGAVFFAQYPLAAVGAFLRGGNVSSLTLAQLQALSGVITITIDGTPTTSSSINLSAATSFTAASQIITEGIGLTGPTQAAITASVGFTGTATAAGTALTFASVTGVIHPGSVLMAAISGTGVPGGTYIVSQTSGTTGGAGVYVTSVSTTAAGASITGTSNVLDVTVKASGTLAVGQEITGSGIDDVFIAAQLTGAAGDVGTYTITPGAQQASEAMAAIMPVCTYDSLSGGFVIISSTTGAASTIGFATGSLTASLKLTAATGAVISQGANVAVPGNFMDGVVALTENFATFQTIFDPDQGSGNTQKLLFSAWVNTTGNQYVYLCTDTDITATASNNASTSMGQILAGLNSSGTVLVYQPVGGGNHLAAFAGGYAASVNFDATNGRATAAFKSQAGITPSVLSVTAKANLIANHYNSYDGVANRGAAWNFFDPGSISGPFKWFDTYINQIWLNNQCQNALVQLLTALGRIPYTQAGYAMIRQALTAGAGTKIALPPSSPVAAGLNNGVITPGVPLSSVQAIEVNTLAGFRVDDTITSQGYYLVIQPASPQTRQARNSPTIILLYTDGGSIQRIDLSSIVIL